MTHSIDDQVYHTGCGKYHQSFCNHCKCSLLSPSKDRWKQHMRAGVNCPIDVNRVLVVRDKQIKRCGVFPVVASTLPATARDPTSSTRYRPTVLPNYRL